MAIDYFGRSNIFQISTYLAHLFKEIIRLVLTFNYAGQIGSAGLSYNNCLQSRRWRQNSGSDSRAQSKSGVLEDSSNIMVQTSRKNTFLLYCTATYSLISSRKCRHRICVAWVQFYILCLSVQFIFRFCVFVLGISY